MKLLLVLTFLTLVCIAQSTPVPLLKARTIILPDYDNISDENDIDDEMNSTTTTTTTTRRSTYLFPTRNRNTLSTRRPWLTQRTTSIKTTTTINADEIDDYFGEEDGFKYFRNIRQTFKKIWEDIKKFFRNITGSDIMKIIQQFFNRKSDD